MSGRKPTGDDAGKAGRAAAVGGSDAAQAARARSLRAQIERLRAGEEKAPGPRSPREELQELEQRERQRVRAPGEVPARRPAAPGARPRASRNQE